MAATETQGPKVIGFLSRRDFIKMGLAALAAGVGLEAGAGGVLFLQARSRESDFGRQVTAGALEVFPPGSVTEFTDEHFFLVRTDGGGFLAVYRRCPHLGCNVNWDEAENGFYCPCHASSFDFYGDYERAPVPRALDLFDLTIADGQVLVNTARLIRRPKFEAEQLVYP